MPTPTPSNITPRVAAGDSFSVLLKTNGTAFAWGDQQLGQLGNDRISTVTEREAQRVGSLQDVRQVSAGQFHALALRGDGQVFAWGSNSDGRLGLGSTGGIFSLPVAVGGATNVTAIAAGRSHTLALRGDGAVLAWGRNHLGQLGLNDTVDRAAPVAIPGLANAVAIAVGANHSFAIRNDGSVWAWGNNQDGQLGLGDLVPRNAPTRVAALDGAGITQLAGGAFHTVARATDGAVWGWGSSLLGQTGRNLATGSSFTTYALPGRIGLGNATAVAAGDEHSIALLTDGTIRTWGNAANGRLGNSSSGQTQSTFVPQTPNVSTVRAIAAGRNHSLVIIQDGRLGCFGSNFLAQCGRIEITDLTTPVEVGPGLRVDP